MCADLKVAALLLLWDFMPFLHYSAHWMKQQRLFHAVRFIKSSDLLRQLAIIWENLMISVINIAVGIVDLICITKHDE